MADQSMQPEQNRAGSSDHEQDRTPEGEGSDSTMAETAGSGPAEVSVYDGQGNERVMVTTDGDDGRAIQGTGDTTEEAIKDAKSEGGPLGPAVGH
jgi:hypothetical protein